MTMMTTLLSIVFVLSASCSRICHAFQAAPGVSPLRQLARRTSAGASLSKLRRNLSESTTNNAAVEEDNTFFARASRQAAQERYAMLLNGEDPFGLFGEVSTSSVVGDSPAAVNSSPVDSGSAVAEDPFIESTESTSESAVKSIKENGLSDTTEPSTNVRDAGQSSPLSSMGISSEKGLSEISDSQYSELLSTISASGNDSNILTGEASGNEPDRYNFQRRLLEARFTMESKKTASCRPQLKSYTAEEAENTPTNWSVASQGATNSFDSEPEKVYISSLPAEENVGGPGCIRKVEEDSTVEKVTYRNREELHHNLFSKKEVAEEETMSTGLNSNMVTVATYEASSAVPKEISTIKEDHQILEKGNSPYNGKDNLADLRSDASPSNDVFGTTELNDENIAMGLLVMTRSFMTLKQILDSKREQG
ncbi:hypothetical protein ACHAW6_014884 [Cyclotella cf. meneghiniana]